MFPKMVEMHPVYGLKPPSKLGPAAGHIGINNIKDRSRKEHTEIGLLSVQ